MNELTVEFSVKDGVEFISLSGGFMGKDVVVRAATDADHGRYASEYEAFKNPPKAEEPAVAIVPPSPAPDGQNAPVSIAPKAEVP